MKILNLVLLVSILLISNFSLKGCEFGYNSWKPLGPGDTIYIISPSHTFPDEESFTKTISFVSEFLHTNFGLNVKYDINTFSQKDPMCPEKAMSTEAAFQDLKLAFYDPEVKAIWAIRGGRLSLELWSLLEAEAKNFPHKPLLGFSDITSLHLFLNNLGFATIHCPVLNFFKESPTPNCNKLTSLDSTFDILMGKKPILEYKGFVPQNISAESADLVQGILFGGNLFSLHYYDSVYGAPDFPAIWMIETQDDYTRIESILEAIQRGRIFKNAQAIIFGCIHAKSYSDPYFDKVQARSELIIKRFANKLNIPVFSIINSGEDSTFSFGHGDLNHPFPLGTKACLQISSDPQDTILKISAS